MLPDSTPLPPLRQELRLGATSPDADGAPRWQLFDPMRDHFFVVGQADMPMLTRWQCADLGQLRTRMARDGLPWDEAAFVGLLSFLQEQQLVQPTDHRASEQLLQRSLQQRPKGLQRLLSAYLGMRFVLWHPQDFLVDTLPLVRALFNRTVLTLWLLATLLGLYLASRQWDSFVGDFAALITPAGMVGYAFALFGLKLIHELGHAYMTVHYGARVSSMGVCVVMGLPMLYTDTTNAQRLWSRRQRMAIGSAGVGAESLVAGLATLAWALLPDGAARSTALVLATSSWLTTLLLNLNPLARFDGYYVLADALRIDNLQPRSLAYAGWAIGRGLLGRVEPPPEDVSPARARLFVGFGMLTWLYRTLLYVSIVWLAWRFLTGAVAALVTAGMVWALLLLPLWRQARQWWGLRERVAKLRRAGLVAAGTLTLLMLTLPLDRRISVPAVFGWHQETLLQSVDAAEVVQVFVQPGQQVEAGQRLFQLRSPELEHQLRLAVLRSQAAKARLDRIAGDSRDRQDVVVLHQQWQEAQAEAAGLQERLARLEVLAVAEGLVVDMPSSMHAGRWVRPGVPLGRLLHGNSVDVRGYIAGRELPRIPAGASARFIADDPTHDAISLRLLTAESAAAEAIAPDMLASAHGGGIATQTDARGQAVPTSAQFAVRFALTQPTPATAIPRLVRGQVLVEVYAESLAEQLARQAWRVLVAELRQ